MLAMRSGLDNYTRDLGFNQTIDSQPGKLWTTDELLSISYSHDEDFAPDTSLGYSNTNTVLLGLIIEQLTGISAADAIKARLFTPLGLTDTYLPPQNDTSLPAPFAHGYLWARMPRRATSPALSPERQAAAKNGTLQPTDVTSASASWGWTAGSGISTIKELAAVVQRMVGGGYLNADLQAKRLTTCTPLVAVGSERARLLSRHRQIWFVLWTQRPDQRLQHLHGVRPDVQNDSRRVGDER